MIREYKAFISYRHLPLDKTFAKKLHRRIEHYVIPRALRKNGVKKLGYVFRDQDELPLSSNLSDSIVEALDRSEFLIVICSPETPNSQWVQREISYFLEHHDRDHVLALIVDGTPDTSFPPLLTQAVDPEGSVRVLEPLAANVAADSAWKRDRLFTSESLRILAALIGCAYDELYKREQRYRTRRILTAAALVTALAAGFIGVLLNRNAAIQANYRRALRNQSSYLAAESLALQEKGDGLGGIALAMEALPQAEQDRPLVSQAEYALGCGLGIYTAPGDASFLTSRDVYYHNATVADMAVSPDGAAFATVSAEPLLSVWDTKTGMLRWTASIGDGDYFYGLAGFLDGDRVVAWGEKALFCFDVRDGSQIWKVDKSSLPDDDGSSLCRVFALVEADLIVASQNKTLFLLNAADGSVRKSLPLGAFESLEGQAVALAAERLWASADGRFAAMPYMVASVDRGVMILDLENGRVRSHWACSEEKPFLSRCMTFTEDGALLCMSSDLNGTSGIQIYNARMISHQTVTLHCLDVQSGEPRWESARSFTDVLSGVCLIWDQTLFPEPAVICAYANRLDVFDAQTGAILAETDYPAPIVGADILNGRIYCYCQDGNRGQIRTNDLSQWYTLTSFCGDLNRVVGTLDDYWVQQRGSNDVIHYCWKEADPSWRTFTIAWENDEQKNNFYPRDSYVDDGCFALLSWDTLLLHDGDPDHPQRPVDLKEAAQVTYGTFMAGGRKNDRFRVLCNAGRRISVLIDMETMETERHAWAREDMDLLSVWGSRKWPGWRALGYVQGPDTQDPEQTLCLLELDDELNILREIPIGSFRGLRSLDAFVDSEGNYVLYLPDRAEAYRIDVPKGRVSLLPASMVQVFDRCTQGDRRLRDTIAMDRADKRLAVAFDDRTLTVMDWTGKTLSTVESETAKIYAFQLSPDGQYLLTVEADNSLRCYDANTGALLTRSSLYSSYIGDSTEFAWSFPDKDFFCLQIDTYMDLIHYEDWTAFAYISSCYGYMEAEDQFCCYDYDAESNRYYGAFARYDLPSLLQYGRDTLRGWQLSDAQRLRYGLD